MKRLILFLICIFLLTGLLSACESAADDEPVPVIAPLPNADEPEPSVNDNPEPEPEPEAEKLLKPESWLPPDTALEIFSGAVFMYNIEFDKVIFARNEHERLPPASIAKLMTMLTVLENVEDLNESVVVPLEVFLPFESGNPNMEDASHAYIALGQDNLTYLDCLYAMMLPSACEAANILAYNAGNGSMEAFNEMMNEKAREIGCLNSNFTNASGLFEDDFYTSAYDMFLITKYTLEKYPLLMEMTNSPAHVMPANMHYPGGYLVQNANYGLQRLHSISYAKGIKIGSIYEIFVDGDYSTPVDGFLTFISYAKRGGLSFIIVSLDADYYVYGPEGRKWSGYHYADHAELYRWAFSTFNWWEH